MALHVMKESYVGSVDAENKRVFLPTLPSSAPAPAAPMKEQPSALKWLALGVPTLMSMVAVPALASTYTISQQNSSILVNTSAGLQGYTINGVNQFGLGGMQESFMRVGAVGSGTFYAVQPATPSPSIAITAPEGVGSFTSLNNAGVVATINYLLTGYPANGAQSGDSALNEQFNLDNTNSTPVTVQFITYADFNLGDQSSGQSATETGGNTVNQASAGGMTLSQSIGQGTASGPDLYEVTNTENLLLALQNTPGYNLTQLDDSSASTGNVNFAFEFDRTIPADSSINLSLNTTITSVPEPTSLAMLLSGGLLLMRRRRRIPSH